MGNHAAGQAMGLAAQHALANRKEGESALALLDSVCSRYKSCDAEFEAVDPDRPGRVHPDFDSYNDPHPGAALGMLMVEAFAPNGLADLHRYAAMCDNESPSQDVAFDAWNEDVQEPFRVRFNFC